MVDAIIASDNEPVIDEEPCNFLPMDSHNQCRWISLEAMKLWSYLLANMVKTKDGMEAAKEIGSFRRGKWYDDAQQVVDEPVAPLIAFLGMGRIVFEIRQELVGIKIWVLF